MAREQQNLAVLFADVCGSSRLYLRYGDETACRLISQAIELVASITARHAGRVVKTIGDEAMCVFSRAEEAVLAACEIHQEILAAPPGGIPIAFHIGVHAGPMIVESADVFGSTVNSAAFLRAVATPHQVLLPEAAKSQLPELLQLRCRPVYSTILKGDVQPTRLYQVQWRPEDPTATDVNINAVRTIPADLGALLVAGGGKRLRVDHETSPLRIGRAPESDLIASSKHASRYHARIEVRRTQFYLVDYSTNGTYVTSDRGHTAHVLHAECILSGSGRICLGGGSDCADADAITYEHDRRALFRI